MANLVSHRAAQNLGPSGPAAHSISGCCRNLVAGQVLDSVLKNVAQSAIAPGSRRYTERTPIAGSFRHRMCEDGENDIGAWLAWRIFLFCFCRQLLIKPIGFHSNLSL